MRLLIIDNGTRHIDQLQAICADHDVTTIGADKLTQQPASSNYDNYDAIILSGSYDHSLVGEQDFYRAEIELVTTTSRPILGICLGFELICYAFGCQLHKLTERAAGATTVIPTDAGAKIFQGTDPLLVTEAHRWNIDDVPRELAVLARSDTGIEAVRHRSKPIYGLQFHPESFVYGSDGKMVFSNILDELKKQGSQKQTRPQTYT